MARDKKHAKGRLDKYYHMAKEQGYRARSAFKLIQLNKKYNFLEKSRCLVDLCAAPGGWLQVAAKYMPKPNVIIGFDLAPIKPIPNVITHVADITTEKCRSLLRTELKNWKVDVFLHDGAPNVGTSWLQDAFSQNELVLSSLKLATQFLAPNGTFVTKVFRSKDYNKLMWVFHQLFAKVEATKPASSRNVSAEIFVVCRDFLAPKKIDPRLLDAKWVFKELDEDGATNVVLDEKKKKERNSALLNDLLHPEKRKRHRGGYDDGDYILHHSASAHEFITKSDFIELLSRSNEISFKLTKEDEEIGEHPLTTDEVKQCCTDLKLLGKKDFKMLIKWREQLRLMLGLDKSKAEIKAEIEAKVANKEETEEDLEELMAQEANLMANREKREKRKAKERKAKVLLKLRMGMDTPMDIGLEAAENGLHGEDIMINEDEQDSNNVSFTQKGYRNENESGSENDDDNEDDVSLFNDSDDERELKLLSLEDQVDQMFESFRSRQLEKDPVAQVKAQKKKLKEGPGTEFDEWYGIEYDLKEGSDDELLNKKSVRFANEGSDDSDFSSADEEEKFLVDDDEDEEPTQLSLKAQTFFSNPIFQTFNASDKEKSKNSKGSFDKEMNSASFSSDDEEEAAWGDVNEKDSTKKSADKKKNKKQKMSEDYEIVPAKDDFESDYDKSDDENFNMEEYAIKTAEAYTMAQKLLTKSGKRDLLDNAYNRWTFHDDEGVPGWFLEDENKHNKPQLPVTKEAVKIMRDRMKALDARPIKKIAEAKYRKQLRTMRRAEKLKKKAEVIAEDGDIGDGQKVRDIQKLMTKASKKQQEKKPTLVVAKGSRRGVKGRPQGVKGRYKMVDPRMKKELKAQKRIEKKQKKSRR